MNDHAIEQQIQVKGLTAPRVTPADIERNIAEAYYFNGLDAAAASCIPEHQGSLSVLTFCVLVLRNGFTVTGESACASPENFDAEIGRQIARENAVNKLWPLMGYALKQQLHEASPCAMCGQVDAGQTGEYPCKECGLPSLHDA